MRFHCNDNGYMYCHAPHLHMKYCSWRKWGIIARGKCKRWPPVLLLWKMSNFGSFKRFPTVCCCTSIGRILPLVTLPYYCKGFIAGRREDRAASTSPFLSIFPFSPWVSLGLLILRFPGILVARYCFAVRQFLERQHAVIRCLLLLVDWLSSTL